MSDRDITLEKAGQTDTSWWTTFLQALQEMPNIARACRAAGVSRQTAYRHKREFEEFSKAWEYALEDALDGWEAEATRRAFEGTDHPVIYQGEVTDTYKEFSDTLAIFLLKAHRPEKYRERSEIKTDGELTIRVKYE